MTHAVSFGQLVVWSSSIDERTPHLFAHCLRDRLRGHPDSLGDRHPPELFGLPGPGVAMEGAGVLVRTTVHDDV